MTLRYSNSGFIFVDTPVPLENIGWTATFLADNDYATVIAQVDRYKELNFSKEYNDVGGGGIKLSLDDSIFTQALPTGQTVPIREQEFVCQVYHNGVLRGAFFAEDVKEGTLTENSDDREIEFTGRGLACVLERAIVLPSGMPAPTSLTRTFTGAAMAAWVTLFNEAKARGTIPYVNLQFSATLDSSGAAWIDNTTFTVQAGDNLLTLLQKFCDALGKRWFMDTQFNVYVYPEEGNHREGAVALSVYGDMSSSERQSTRRELANYIAAQAGDNAVAVATSSTSISRWGRREQWLQAGSAGDVGTAQQIANASAKLTSDQKTSRSFKVAYDSPGALVFGDYDVGDWVGVEVQDFVVDVGAFEGKHVAAISIKVDNDNNVDCECTFESRFEVRSRVLQRIIEKLGGGTVGGGTSQGSAPLVVNTSQLAATKLSDLADVQLTTLLPNQVLTWNGTKWTNANGAVSPSAPTGLTASAALLSWTAPSSSGSSPISDYVIQYRTTAGPGAWTTWSHTASTATTAAVTGLSPGTSYDFQVAAVNVVGAGPFSNIATGVTLSPPARRGISSGAHTTGSTVTITYPSGLAVGDLMILTLSDAWVFSTPPSGWYSIVSTSASNINGAVLWKIATAADVATPTSSYTVSGSNVGNWVIVAYQAGTFSPSIFATQAQTPSNVTTLNVTSPPIAPGGILLTFDAAISTTPVLSANQGSLIRTQSDGTTKAYEYELATGAATQTYNVTWSSTAGAPQYAAAIAIQNVEVPMISDNFNRADTSAGTLGTSSDGFQTWIMTGGFSILSNAATSNGLSFAVINPGDHGFDAIVTVKLAALVSGEFTGVVGRYNDSNNHYLVQYQQSSNSLMLYKRVGGTYTQLGSTFTQTWAAGDTIGLYMKGTTIKAQWNGVDKISVTDATAFTNWYVGLYSSGGSTAKRYDDFLVTAP